MLERVGRTLANYTILEAIGQGGLATVYRAQDLRDRSLVASKVLSPYVAFDPNFRGRFDREVAFITGESSPASTRPSVARPQPAWLGFG
jgi:serine/threonine protein kinase